METTQKNTKWLGLVFLLLVIATIVWFLMGQKDTTNEVAESTGAGEDASMSPGVPLSGTDESMPLNASNEKDRGQETTIYINIPGTTETREATADEYYRFENSGIELAFDHVAPGEYSEVYGSVTGVPGESYTVKLTGPGVVNPEPKTVTIGEDGYTRVTWRITQYGTYTATHNFAEVEHDIFEKKASIVVN